MILNSIVNVIKKRRYRLNFEILATEWLNKKKIGLKETGQAIKKVVEEILKEVESK